MTWRNRRPDHWSSEHERARILSAARLDGDLPADDAAWLDAHLQVCDPCRAVDSAYADQRRALRSLADPEPPRDLWARTAAAIERESVAPARRTRQARRPLRPVPLGLLSGALVVVVVAGAALLSSRAAPSLQRLVPPVALGSSSPSGGPVPTPIDVTAFVSWVQVAPDGSATLNSARVDRVCPGRAAPDCATIREATRQKLQLAVHARAIVQSPSDTQIVVVDQDTLSTGGDVYVLDALAAPAGPSVSPGRTAATTPPPGSPSATGTPLVTRSPDQSVRPSASPSPSPEVPLETEPSPPPAVASPTAAPTRSGNDASHEPASPSPTPVITASPSVTPLPSGSAGPLAIISDVVVVGENAAYAPDGEWFAFTARPADGSTGPDVYVWRNGEERAQAVTTDHRSFFSAWLGDRLVISSAAAFRSSPGQPELIPSSYLVDPATGHRTEMVDTNLWRPVADPEQRWTVGWDGTIRATADGSSIEPAAGRLVLRPWGGRLVEGGAPLPTTATKVLAMGDIHDWDARWDESGHHLAVWIADADTPGIGRLTLYETDPVTGTIDDDHPLLRDEPARSGFAIGRGRLAWATPAGENGEGSRVEVLAWKAGSAGQANSQPGSGEVLVTR